MKSKQQGSSLIEVLIAVLIVSIGLLGMATLQLKSMALNLTAYQRLQAATLAYEIADSIYLNSTEASKNWYKLSLSDTSGGIAASSAMSTIDKKHWLEVVAEKLPKGDLVIGPAVNIPAMASSGATATIKAKTYAISICWQDKNAAVSAASTTCGSKNSEFSFVAGSRRIK
ncbi:MAG: hypothetical protein OFPII_21290 [Osedax symbiont Rs1]|nr:MAG: hypothetical protein OFPII_21290 [Osedax symbiont Rs1]